MMAAHVAGGSGGGTGGVESLGGETPVALWSPEFLAHPHPTGVPWGHSRQ